MSFLQRFLERVFRNNTSRMPRTSFDDLSQEQLDAHLRVGRYGKFTLTDAVRPSFGLEVIPREGYRRDVYCDPETGNKMPVLAASVSAERSSRSSWTCSTRSAKWSTSSWSRATSASPAATPTCTASTWTR